MAKVGGIQRERRIGLVGTGVWRTPDSAGWNTALGLAADLQLASALADTDLVEYKTGSPYIDEIVQGGWQLDADGMLSIPDRPGLGIELDMDAVARYT